MMMMMKKKKKKKKTLKRKKFPSFQVAQSHIYYTKTYNHGLCSAEGVCVGKNCEIGMELWQKFERPTGN